MKKKRENIPSSLLEDGGELHLDVSAGAYDQQHHRQKGMEIEERRLQTIESRRLEK